MIFKSIWKGGHTYNMFAMFILMSSIIILFYGIAYNMEKLGFPSLQIDTFFVAGVEALSYIAEASVVEHLARKKVMYVSMIAMIVGAIISTTIELATDEFGSKSLIITIVNS